MSPLPPPPPSIALAAALQDRWRPRGAAQIRIGLLGAFSLLALCAAGSAVAARKPRAALNPDAVVPEPAHVLSGTVLHVIDGDTLVLRPRSPAGAANNADAAQMAPRPLRIRLSGVDAPELCQRGGGEARQALADLVAGRQVQLRMFTLDRYARIVARVSVDGEDVAARLVAQGLAWSESRTSRRAPYADLEQIARHQHRGVFALDETPTRPKDFRAEHGACPHAPGSRLRHLGARTPQDVASGTP